MSSFYDDASLVMIPSCYKTSTVLCEKPTDGSGDLTFTRTGDTATRVNSSGLVEKVRTNLLLQSQTFDNASWIKANAGNASNPVVIANDGTAPDGTTTADKVVFVATDNTGISELAQSSTKNGTYAGSIYIKAFAAGDVGKIIGFRFASGTYALITLTADWQRFLVSQTGSLSTFDLTLRPSQGTSTGTVSVYIWGAQLETGDVATAYIPTTTAAVSVGPVANLARLDYLNSSCPRLLLEPQRTNLATYSEAFGSWTQISVNVTSNNTTSPSGYLDADKIECLNSGSESELRKNISLGSSGTAYTTSIYAKKGTARYLRIRNLFVNGGASQGNAWFDLDNVATATVQNGQSATIESFGNGWVRCTLTGTFTGVSYDPLVDIGFTDTNGTVKPSATVYGYLYGAQIEAGAYATSYIPTLGAAVTRGADACSKTGISSLIGQTEGVFFADFVVNGQSNNANIINSERNTNASFFIGAMTNGKIDAGIFSNGSVAVRILQGNVSVGQRAKVAFAYKSGSSALYINGALVGTTSSTFTLPSTIDDIFLNDPTTFFNYQENVSFNQVLLFKTRLTNAQLAELTTL